MSMPTEVHIAGVPWPAYKLVALAIGALVLVVVGIATASPAPALLGATAATAISWLGLRYLHSSDL